MTRGRRLLVIAAAWAFPVAWIALALLSGPSDGTTLARSALGAGDRWGQSVRVADAYGDTLLRTGDQILSIDRRSLGDWVRTRPPPREVGDQVRYQIQRSGAGLDLIFDVDVALTRYPIADALVRNLPRVAVAILLVGAGSLAFYLRPRALSTRAFLAASALVPCALTRGPLGLGAIDLAGGRGVWPLAGGGVLSVLGLGFLVLAALALARPPAPVGRPGPVAVPARPAVALPVALPLVALPLVAGALSPLLATRGDPGPARLQAQLDMLTPALVTAAVVVPVVLAHGLARAAAHEHRAALRLALLALAGGVGVRALLADVPRWLGGQALVADDVLSLLLAPAVLGCVVVSLVGRRVTEVEPAVRRALVNAGVAAFLGAAFVAIVAGMNQASGRSFASMVAGGVVAVLLLPVAVALRRTVRRLMYGDRELPRRLVSELRRVDPLTPPAAALDEALELLARRLRLSYAALEVYPRPGLDPVSSSTGEPRGQPTQVDLVAGGVSVGRLTVEVDPSRDPFGPGDRPLLEDVGGQLGVLVHAVSINRALQASRRRLVAAREEERRRVRRDLHDGLGPSLATLALGLEAAGDLIEDDPPAAVGLVAQLSEQARANIAEIRRLVDGLRPSSVDQLGLVSALRQRADEHNLAARGAGQALTWTVLAEDDLEPLPAAVEVAAYRIALEAVTNAIRHSDADTCTVTLCRDADLLLVRIQDSGIGVDQTAAPGVGMTSMRARAEELGGTCTVTSERGGTVVEARLPLSTPMESRRAKDGPR